MLFYSKTGHSVELVIQQIPYSDPTADTADMSVLNTQMSAAQTRAGNNLVYHNSYISVASIGLHYYIYIFFFKSNVLL